MLGVQRFEPMSLDFNQTEPSILPIELSDALSSISAFWATYTNTVTYLLLLEVLGIEPMPQVYNQCVIST